MLVCGRKEYKRLEEMVTVLRKARVASALVNELWEYVEDLAMELDECNLGEDL